MKRVSFRIDLRTYLLPLMLLLCITPIAGTDGGGPRGSAVQELDLREFIELVERNSLQLELAATERSIAESQERLARTQLYPLIAGEVGYTRNFLDITQPTPVGLNMATGDFITEDVKVNSDNDLTVGVSLQQKLFDMNVFRGLEASSRYTDLTVTTYDLTRQATLTGAKRLFFQVLLLQEVLEVREKSEEIAYENYLDTQKRLENGIASPLEALQAELSWKLAIPNTSQADKNLNIALAKLRSMAGLDKERELQLFGSLEDLPPLPEFLPPVQVQGERPDYRLLQNQKTLREINISVERSKFYPSVSASVTYGLQGGSDTFDFSDPTDTFSAGISVSIPIFYGGSRFVSLGKAKQELERTKTEIAAKQLSIATELENIELSLQEAKLRIDTARQTLRTAEKAYEVSETSVENGLATQLELKDARMSLDQARLGYLKAGFDYLSSYFDWQMATGSGAELILAR